ncbi:S1 RNA-binding domain-containing protein [Shewanella maritima]|uniref:CvfB family protein n=1 Tax=Shewanella maritima TaxID=2520507 RepID=UPI0037350A84
MIDIGKRYTLEVVKQVSFGVYLNALELGQVLLPKKYVPQDCEVGDMLDVFLYLDSEDMVVATTQQAKAEVGKFAYLKAVATNKVGAFLDWGLDKDLLLPFGEQKRPVEEGRSYLVYVHINHVDDRIVASNKVDKFLDKTPPAYKEGEEVDLIIGGKTDLGFKAIINNQHWGVLYQNQVFKKIYFGQSMKGYIKQVRNDGKIDLVLQQGGKTELDKHATLIIAKLTAANGFLPLNDKTDADIIYSQLSMSKKAFKKSIGGLYKAGKIRIETDGIYLAE